LAGTVHPTVAETLFSCSIAATQIHVGAFGAEGTEATVNVLLGDRSDSPIEFQADILISTSAPVDKPVFSHYNAKESVTSYVR